MLVVCVIFFINKSKSDFTRTGFDGFWICSAKSGGCYSLLFSVRSTRRMRRLLLMFLIFRAFWMVLSVAGILSEGAGVLAD